MRRAAVFLDRDGTLVDELGFLTRADDLHLLPGAAEGVRLANEAGLAVIVVTNQSGIARGLLTERDLAEIHRRLAEELARGGARLDAILHCPHHPDEGEPPLRRACDCRKPAPGLLFEAARKYDLDLGASWIVGDGTRDLEAGRAADLAGGILVLTGKGALEWRALSTEERARTRTARDLPAAVRAILGEKTEPQGR